MDKSGSSNSYKMDCPELKRLWDLYMGSLAAFHESQKPFLDGIRPHDSHYSRMRVAKERATSELIGARKNYWDHVQSHGCRQSVKAAGNQRQTLDRLRSELESASGAFQRALEKFHPLIQIMEDVGPTADGFEARKQARRIYTDAYRRYRSALERYTNFVLRDAASGENGDAGGDEAPGSV